MRDFCQYQDAVKLLVADQGTPPAEFGLQQLQPGIAAAFETALEEVLMKQARAWAVAVAAFGAAAKGL